MMICKKYEKIRKNTKKYEFEILGVRSYFFELDPPPPQIKHQNAICQFREMYRCRRYIIISSSGICVGTFTPQLNIYIIQILVTQDDI